MPFDPDDPASRCRREVGVLAREAWSALQEMLARFRDVKEQRDSRTLRESRRACDEAQRALDRLQHALASLGRRIHDHRDSIAPRESLH